MMIILESNISLLHYLTITTSIYDTSKPNTPNNNKQGEWTWQLFLVQIFLCGRDKRRPVDRYSSPNGFQISLLYEYDRNHAFGRIPFYC